MNLSRRSFLKFSWAIPALAAPAIAGSAVAVSESVRASQTLRNIQMSKEGVIFQGCSFQMKDFVMHGSHQLISWCHFDVSGGTGIQIRQPYEPMLTGMSIKPCMAAIDAAISAKEKP